MMKQSFERYEKKYKITRLQASEMIAFLNGHLALDKHHDPKNIVPYKIHSLYLDDKDARIIHKSIEKPSYKEKYRLRWYEDPNQKFLEVKIKHLARSHKKRMTFKEDSSLINNFQSLILNTYPSSYLTSITQDPIEKYCLIEYDRIAFEDQTINLRITFDYDVSYTFLDEKKSLFDSDSVILEIKYDQSLPRFLSQYLSSHHIYSRSISKIGLSVQQHKGATVCL
jgi:hypothetical protein